ncbi:MAG: pilus assembly protein TadG-related protein [Gammaproteobacteria bacterium]|nr:pilus assembly protein TadG-related protein [Gammaproteobacteria bacterium]
MASLAVMLQVIDPRRWRAGRGEGGDIAIIAAIVMPIMILALAFGIDIGHMAYVHRNLQKIADMAAIAGAEDVSNAMPLATGNAVKNGLQTSSTQITVTPGNWNPQVEAGPTYFSAAVPYGHQANAVQVQLSESVPYFFFFGPAKTVQAQAIAWVPNPAAGFSLSSTLLQVSEQQSALLNSLLGGLLGIHNLNLGVAAFNGLLNTSVSLGQLAQSIGVGTVNNLLDANLTLPGLFTGALKAVGNQAAGGGLLNTQAATGALQTLIGSTTAQSTIQLSNILKLGLADKNAAVNAQVNLLDLVTASAMLSNQKHFIQIPSLGVNVPGIANIGLGLNVISPPSIAYGEPGRDASGQWRTQAHTAQVALSLQIQLLSLLGGGVVNIPIYLEVAPAQAHLTSLTCGTPVSQSQVGIGANTGLLTAVIGTPLPNALNNTTQSINELAQNFQGVDLVNVLGLITVHLNHPLIVPLSAQGLNGYQELNFTGTPSQTQDVTTNALGSAVSQTLQALETELQKPGALTVHAVLLNLPVGQIVGLLLGILNPVLQPLLQVLNDLVAPLLNLLGIQVGQAAVNYNALSCGTIPPVLVY